MNEIKILGIVGSLRKDSYNHFALKAAQELLPAGVTLDLIELHGIPLFNQGLETKMPSCSPPRNTTIPYPACSRTPSTGPHGLLAKAPGPASRRR